MQLLHAFIVLLLLLPLQRADLAPSGTLRASFIENNPVQGRVDGKTGAVTGPAADLVRELAQRLGIKFEITPLPSAGAVLESVRSGKADIGFLAYEAARATKAVSHRARMRSNEWVGLTAERTASALIA